MSMLPPSVQMEIARWAGLDLQSFTQWTAPFGKWEIERQGFGCMALWKLRARLYLGRVTVTFPDAERLISTRELPTAQDVAKGAADIWDCLLEIQRLMALVDLGERPS